MWEICFGISATLLAISLLLFLLNIKLKIVRKSISVLMVGFVAAAFVLFVPIQRESYGNVDFAAFISVLTSFQKSLRIFGGGIEFSYVKNAVIQLQDDLRKGYEIVGLILVTIAPVLTLGAVVSFLKNAMAYQQYMIHYFSDVYIFSEVNEKTVALAESIRKTDEKCMLLFMNALDGSDETKSRLYEQANNVGAIFFKRSINDVDFRFHSKKSQIFFMVMGSEETENIVKTLNLIDRYQDFYNARIYVLAKTAEAELMLKSKDMGKIKLVRRFKESESLIFKNLYETGQQIFQHVRGDGEEKVISALILGMGEYGKEMAKALLWFCQMIGYRFELRVVDQDRSAASKFEMQCPDILSSKYNGVRVDGEPNYQVKIYSGMDVNTGEFRKMLQENDTPTYVFVSLGSDTQNVKTALDIKSFYGDQAFQPRIHAILYKGWEEDFLKDAKEKQSSNGAANGPEIEFIGDLKTSYSKDTVLYSIVESEALKRHMMWGSNEHSFWTSEYNYRSSIASMLHQKMKCLCGIPYAEELPENRPEKEREALRKLEHCRWSAYVRTEGYTWGEKRNDLAKKHPCLIPYEELSPKEKAKDDV